MTTCTDIWKLRPEWYPLFKSIVPFPSPRFRVHNYWILVQAFIPSEACHITRSLCMLKEWEHRRDMFSIVLSQIVNIFCWTDFIRYFDVFLQKQSAIKHSISCIDWVSIMRILGSEVNWVNVWGNSRFSSHTFHVVIFPIVLKADVR